MKLLKKGLEVELYAGTKTGEVLPLSSKLHEKFPDFSQEPDERNFEYITKPCSEYHELFEELIKPRIKIRNFLETQGDLTLIPGSTLSLPFEKSFSFSKPGDPYHEYIFKTYKTNIITTSLHINFGIDDYNNLFKLLCALRLDTALFLALSASSCFFDGEVTDYQSYRWHNFPKTPEFVPFFKDHKQFIGWTNEQITSKKMFNVRHLWSSIRPNGPNRPNDLNRIEIRICDLVTDTKKVLAIVCLIECLIQKYLTENNWPKVFDKMSDKNENELIELTRLTDRQEDLVAKLGLNAKIWDWRNNCTNEAYKVIESIYNDLANTAKKLGILEYLKPIVTILNTGNEATQFLNSYNKTKSISATLQHFIEEFSNLDLKYSEILKNPSGKNI